MQQTARLLATQNAEYQAVDIPYTGGQLSMTLVMPAAGTMDTFLSGLSAGKLADTTNKLESNMVALAMPKFEFSSSPAPRAMLQGLGMGDAFDAFKADFSGIDGQRDVFISDIVHKAFISVDETGSEAAAATAVIAIASSAMFPPPHIMNLTFDHPFIFLICDRETGLVVFMGKVAKP
jgi:serpin B